MDKTTTPTENQMTNTTTPVARIIIEGYNLQNDAFDVIVEYDFDVDGPVAERDTTIDALVLSLMLCLQIGNPDAFQDRQFTQYEQGGPWVETSDSGCPL